LKKITALLVGLLFIFSALSVSWAQDTVHVVKKGDTLWDITKHYLKNPWKWPVVWSNNEDITNPHLIYPGDRVIISSKGGKTTITIIPAKGGQPTVFTTDGIRDKSFLLSPQYSSYVFSPTPLEGAGTVAKKLEQGDLVSRNDGIIIKSKSALTEGKIVTIFTKITEAKDNDVVKGYLYRAIGFARVQKNEGNLYKALVLDSSQEIRMDDVVLNDLKAIAPMKVKLYEPSLKAPGRVIDLYGGTVDGSSYLDLIFLNIGKNDGVDEGALVSIHKEFTVEGEAGTIRDYKGNAMVIQALDDTSMALVTESVADIQRGFVVFGGK
jgi:hypothetical protein